MKGKKSVGRHRAKVTRFRCQEMHEGGLSKIFLDLSQSFKLILRGVLYRKSECFLSLCNWEVKGNFVPSLLDAWCSLSLNRRCASRKAARPSLGAPYIAKPFS